MTKPELRPFEYISGFVVRHSFVLGYFGLRHSAIGDVAESRTVI
jgi:hypothetical protein